MIVRTVASPEDLAGNNNAVSTPSQLLDHVAHDDLGISTCIGFRIVVEIDPRIVGGGHTFDGNVLTDLPTICDPSAQR